ncbi:MAG TPA: methyltransferase [Pseudorhodoplanes sp.]|nr:methyltransferase [Pseudorhodoplanes sp.]
MLLSSGDLVADRRFEWARDCEAKGDLAGAADLLEQALELVPNYASAWFTLGEIGEKLGDRERAVAAYRRAREADPDDRHGALVCLMRLGAVDVAEMPPAYVQALFDHYAPAFDAALVGGLNYRAPALLRDAVEAACKAEGRPMRFGAMLDLGCGTGLAGEAFRAHVDWLVGIDLSLGMIAQARKKTIYDRLQAEDLSAFLNAAAANRLLYHLAVAADVFVYFPDLAAILGAAARVLESDGILAFTVETHPGEGAILRDTLRFAHGEAYVRAALDAAGLTILSLQPVSTRTEKKIPVPGLMAVARRGP